MEERSRETSKGVKENKIAAKVRWNTNNLCSSYANVCNVTCNHEEVVLNFGINQNWERAQGEVEVQLTNRVILSPFAAKRLSLVLNELIRGYESRYGELRLDAPAEGSTVRQ